MNKLAIIAAFVACTAQAQTITVWRPNAPLGQSSVDYYTIQRRGNQVIIYDWVGQEMRDLERKAYERLGSGYSDGDSYGQPAQGAQPSIPIYPW